ncbi:anthranilate synthase / indole-3-glycerol phosphate synthase [Spiromyces aspiralis]|uniref:Anthranilate synthase / indole-3-glycerol phosphate synthase n=1 Tax=Spiromyces aspiralis TaxID=68401 RepID=A0ACC1HUQ1_9FUNG|nr:anthranilate synthase / indole-3-glycerol phosphate synthase [Spiromyces aspiralis]
MPTTPSRCSAAGTVVKICGVSRPEDAICAAESGTDLIGIIFAKSSRQVSLPVAKQIASAVRSLRPPSSTVRKLDPNEYSNASDDRFVHAWFADHAKQVEAAEGPFIVGVFQNQPLEDILHIAQSVPLDIVQLHGDEPLSLTDQIPLPVIKAFHIDDEFDLESSGLSTPLHHAFILLDTKVKGADHQGGKGVSFDWNIAGSLVHNTGLPLIMAGGLTPSNVSKAIQVGTPWGVDVSSGVEQDAPPDEGGKKKDAIKIRQFVYNSKQQQQPQPS